jgi:hypothetical protein
VQAKIFEGTNANVDLARGERRTWPKELYSWCSLTPRYEHIPRRYPAIPVTWRDLDILGGWLLVGEVDQDIETVERTENVMSEIDIDLQLHF